MYRNIKVAISLSHDPKAPDDNERATPCFPAYSLILRRIYVCVVQFHKREGRHWCRVPSWCPAKLC
jgi:hypothetical protein